MRTIQSRRSLRPATAAYLATALVALLAAAPVARAAYGIHDNANLFKPEAIQQGQQVLDAIKQTHQRDVLIETYPSIPGAPTGEGQEQARNQFFTNWIIQRGRAQDVRGMMVLIVMDPPHLQVYVGKTTEAMFPRADQDDLQRKLAQALRDKHYDNALVQTANFINERMDEHDARGGAGTAGGPSSSGGTPSGSGSTGTGGGAFPVRSCGGGGIGTFLCLGAAVLIVFLIVRGIFGGRRSYGPPPMGGPGYGPGPGYGQPGYGQPGYGPGYGGGGGGGGFGRGMLGGLFGGLLGGYAADRFLHHGQGGGGGGNVGGGAGTTGGTSTGADYGAGGAGSDFGPGGSSTGSDFGTPSGGGGADYSSGGSDFGSSGGSDSGGGGGSDFSGGGSDFGGGGGGGDSGGSSGSDF
jgi:hypothetical protein